ncbi:MAG: hypothetical protein EVA66_01690 [OM182 bacterium]|nr:MAG: hypothetical protein EVA66_01690 [OM182 bacterium]
MPGVKPHMCVTLLTVHVLCCTATVPSIEPAARANKPVKPPRAKPRPMGKKNIQKVVSNPYHLSCHMITACRLALWER